MMNEVLSAISSHGYLIGVFVFLVVLIRAAVDFWFVTELEKILMTDYQKIKGLFSKLVITVLPIVCITFGYIIASDKSFLIELEPMGSNILLIFLLFIIFLLNMLLHLSVLLLEYIFNLKSTYFMRINEEDWVIERLTKDNHLLLANANNEFLLIDSWKHIKIKRVVNENSFTYKIYSKKAVWITCLVLCGIITSLSVLTWIFAIPPLLTSFSFFIICLSIIAIMIILVNRFEYNRAIR